MRPILLTAIALAVMWAARDTLHRLVPERFRDQYANLHTWHGWRDLLQRVTLAVAQRPGSDAAATDPRVRAAPQVALQMPPMDISATDIRARVAAGQAIDTLVPPAVAQYIHQHRLYRGAAGS